MDSLPGCFLYHKALFQDSHHEGLFSGKNIGCIITVHNFHVYVALLTLTPEEALESPQWLYAGTIKVLQDNTEGL